MLQKMSSVLVIALSLLFISQTAQAASSVWQVKKDNNTLYLAGTLHLLEASDYPLPSQFEQAFKASDIIVFETDVAEAQSPQFQQTMMAAMFNQGTKLKSQLSSGTWNKLENQLAKRGIPLMQFNDFKVSMALLTLTITEYQAMGFTAPGVDATFFEMAKKAKKKIQSLETPGEQIRFLAEMGSEDPEGVVKYTLDELKQLPDFVSKLKTAWFSGDLKALEELGLKEMRASQPQMYQSLISARNENWLKQIESYITTPKKEAIYVGALHLAGKDGLVSRLKDMGYTVEKL